jgi:phosphohistidine phosphatase SixA
MLYLLRHASAGHRDSWIGDDRARPLDGPGRQQAAEVAELLSGRPLTRAVTSPYLRCVQTLEPLAQERRLPLEYRHELGDDASVDDARVLLRELDGDAVLCSHGDLIRELLGEELAKGEIAAVEMSDDGIVIRERLGPADSAGL